MNFKITEITIAHENDDLEILDQYNNEIRGFRNYYRIANNSAHAGSFGYIMQYSFFKTLGRQKNIIAEELAGEIVKGSEAGVTKISKYILRTRHSNKR